MNELSERANREIEDMIRELQWKQIVREAEESERLYGQEEREEFVDVVLAIHTPPRL